MARARSGNQDKPKRWQADRSTVQRSDGTGGGKPREETFNIALGEVLQNSTAQWRANPSLVWTEHTDVSQYNKRKRPDILIVDPRSPPLAIECSYGAADANKDAKERLGLPVTGHGEIKTAISLHIPESFRRLSSASARDALNNGTPIRYAIHQRVDDGVRRWPEAGFIEGSVQDLAALLATTSLPKEDIERTAREVAALIDEAAGNLGALPERAKQEISSLINRGSVLKGLKTAMVLWLDALLTQQRLQGQNVPGVPPLDFASEKPPRFSSQVKVWRQIKEKNWRAIFKPAIDVLEIAGKAGPRETGEALARLTDAVENIESANLGLHINVGAELFPKLSEDRKQAAAFYTQPSTAELLAALTIRPDELSEAEWADSGLFSTRSLADLACGTGTLLRAGYRRIQTIHETFGGTVESVTALHQRAMETGLVGTDISPIAAHLTSASLAAIGQGEPYGDTRIGWVNVGGANDATGSLEYLKTSSLQDLFQSVAGRSTGADKPDDFSVHVTDSSVDWILMNPPYSRARRGQAVFDVAGVSESKRKACQTRWGKLIDGRPANAQAGLAASFLVLARQKVRLGGRIGFVLPLTAAFADTWTTTRDMIEREFVDIVAIAVAAGQALGQDALSADTNMEEMLLVATRRTRPAKEGKRAPVKCVTLFAPVTRSGEARETARAIDAALDKVGEVGTSRPIMVGKHEIGAVYVFDPGAESAPWSPLGATHTGLAFAADRLARGRLDFDSRAVELPTEMTTLGGLFEVGPTHHLIGYVSGNEPGGAFEFFKISKDADAIGRDRALWSADHETQCHLVVLPTHRGERRPLNHGGGERRVSGRCGRNAGAAEHAVLCPKHALDVTGASGGHDGERRHGGQHLDCVGA